MRVKPDLFTSMNCCMRKMSMTSPCHTNGHLGPKQDNVFVKGESHEHYTVIADCRLCAGACIGERSCARLREGCRNAVLDKR